MTRILGWLLVAFAAYFLLTNPDGAAAFVHGILGWLQHAASSLSTFASHL
ncbi:MAG TPA: hypothetical protein VME44_25845 [Streptosporangiaceae bacterium]|nr:hypothetical protein [Streptosporangiaceae bacterium]